MNNHDNETVKVTKTGHQNGEEKFVFTLVGALTFKTVVELWENRQQFYDGAADNIVLDMSQIYRTDSAGLAFLLSLLRESKYKDLQLQFVNVPQQLIDISHLSGLDAILPIR